MSLAVDPSGNIAVGGYTISIDFPTKNPVHVRTKTIFTDGFITKFAADGRSILFSTYLGGDGIDNFERLTTDASGNTYACGSTTSDDFPTLNGLPARFPGFSLTELAFLTKLSPTGSLVYSGLWGGFAGDNECRGIALDRSGNIYLSGLTAASDFPVKNPLPGTAATSMATSRQAAAWLAKVGADGQTVAYSTLLTGAASPSIAQQVAVDAQDNPVVAGFTAAPISARNAVQPTYAGNIDGFVMKVNGAGTDFLYSTYLGGAGSDEIYGLALASDGTVYVAGLTTDGSFPQHSSLQPYAGGQDSFVAALSATGDV
jgi:hypothetical protein